MGYRRSHESESSTAAIGKQISVLMLLLEEALYFLKILLFFVSPADVAPLASLGAMGTMYELKCSFVFVS